MTKLMIAMMKASDINCFIREGLGVVIPCPSSP